MGWIGPKKFSGSANFDTAVEALGIAMREGPYISPTGFFHLHEPSDRRRIAAQKPRDVRGHVGIVRISGVAGVDCSPPELFLYP